MNSLRNQFCSASALSYGVVAEAVTANAWSIASGGTPDGSSRNSGPGGDDTVAWRSTSAGGTATSAATV